MGDVSQVLFIFECHLCNPFVVSLSNHEWTALRQAQGERKIDDKTKMKRPLGDMSPYFHFVEVSDTVTPPFVGLGVVYDAIE